MVENLRACFILYAITIKWTMYVEERIELSRISQRQRQRLNSTEKFRDLSLTTKMKQQCIIAKIP